MGQRLDDFKQGIGASAGESGLDQDLQLRASVTYLGANVAIELFLDDDYPKTSAMQTQTNAQSQTLVDRGIYDVLEAVMHQNNSAATFLLIVQRVLRNAGHHERSPLRERARLDLPAEVILGDIELEMRMLVAWRTTYMPITNLMADEAPCVLHKIIHMPESLGVYGFSRHQG